jgi:uncharacterized membrane protein
MSSEGSTGSPRSLQFIRNSWRGDEQLVTTFWCGGLACVCITLTSLFAALIGGMICLGPIAIVFGVSPGRAYELAAGLIFLCGLGVAATWWLVAVWRCAPNTRQRAWFLIARGIVICEAAAGLAFLVFGLDASQEQPDPGWLGILWVGSRGSRIPGIQTDKEVS